MTGHNWLDSQSFRLLVVPCRPPGPHAHLTLIQYFNLQSISNFINCHNIFQPKFTDCIWLSHFFGFLSSGTVPWPLSFVFLLSPFYTRETEVREVEHSPKATQLGNAELGFTPRGFPAEPMFLFSGACK